MVAENDLHAILYGEAPKRSAAKSKAAAMWLSESDERQLFLCSLDAVMTAKIRTDPDERDYEDEEQHLANVRGFFAASRAQRSSIHCKGQLNPDFAGKQREALEALESGLDAAEVAVLIEHNPRSGGAAARAEDAWSHLAGAHHTLRDEIYLIEELWQLIEEAEGLGPAFPGAD